MNIQVSPESQTVAQSDQQRILKLLEVLDPIIRKHGFDYYLFSVHTPHGSKGGLLPVVSAPMMWMKRVPYWLTPFASCNN